MRDRFGAGAARAKHGMICVMRVERHAARWLLVLALALALAAGLHGIRGPWELGFRGTPGVYCSSFVHSSLTYGFRELHFAPAFVFSGETDHCIAWYWHHPPLYYLYLAAAALVLGHHEWSLRLAQLLLFLPSVPLLYLLVARIAGALPAGMAALLYVSIPLVGCYGPMVYADGAMLTFGIAATLAFLHHIDTGRRGSLWLAAGCHAILTQLDFLGHLFGVAWLLLALRAPSQARALRAVGVLCLVSFGSILLVAAHYGTFLGGPRGFFGAMVKMAANSYDQRQEVGAAALVAAATGWGGRLIGWPHVLLIGIAIAVRAGRAPGRPAVARLASLGGALTVPAILSCALFLPHAVAHECWPLIGMAGVAVVAVITPLVGLDLAQRGPRRSRIVGVLLVTASAFAVLSGVVATHRMVAAVQVDPRVRDSEPVQELREVVAGCALALSDLDAGVLGQFVGTLIHGNVDTVDALERRLRAIDEIGCAAPILFLMATAGRGQRPALETRLAELGSIEQRRYWTVWRLRPPPRRR